MANEFIITGDTYQKLAKANQLLDNLMKAVDELSAIGMKVDGTIDSLEFSKSLLTNSQQ